MKTDRPQTETSIIAKEARHKARILMGTELVFVLIPFVFLGLNYLKLQSSLLAILSSPEWSLAASILCGQTVARLVAGFAKYKRIPNWEMGTLYVALLILASYVGVYLYSNLQDPANATLLMIGFQLLLFTLSVYWFIVFGATAQRLLDTQEK